MGLCLLLLDCSHAMLSPRPCSWVPKNAFLPCKKTACKHVPDECIVAGLIQQHEWGFFKCGDEAKKTCALHRCIFEDRAWVMSWNLGTAIWEQFTGLLGFLCYSVS